MYSVLAGSPGFWLILSLASCEISASHFYSLELSFSMGEMRGLDLADIPPCFSLSVLPLPLLRQNLGQLHQPPASELQLHNGWWRTKPKELCKFPWPSKLQFLLSPTSFFFLNHLFLLSWAWCMRLFMRPQLSHSGLILCYWDRPVSLTGQRT